MSGRFYSSRLPLLILIGCLALVSDSSARADYDPIGSGQTRIALDKSFLSGLREHGVRLSAVAPAKLSGPVLTVRAVGGKFDPVAAVGTVESEGSLILSAGGRKVPIKEFNLRTTQEHSPFTAKVGGSQLKVASAARVSVGRSGFADTASVTGLALSQKLATRLGKKLDLRPFFKAGLPLGKAFTVAVPQTVSIIQRDSATLTFDPGFVAKLGSLFVAVNPIFPAEHQEAVFTLPLFGGDLGAAIPTGRLATSGSLEFLQLGGGQVFWREPRLGLEAKALSGEIDVEPSPPFAGKAGVLPVAPVSVVSYTADARARTVSGGISLALDPAMASTFNETFAKPQGKAGVFVGGEAVGTLAFDAQAQ